MWLPNDIVAAVNEVARVSYVDARHTKHWNAHRREGELRLLTGWCWTSKSGDRVGLGLKTMTACYRDAWYELVARSEAPSIARPRLRVIAGKRGAA
jgi:hypothetical protein